MCASREEAHISPLPLRCHAIAFAVLGSAANICAHGDYALVLLLFRFPIRTKHQFPKFRMLAYVQKVKAVLNPNNAMYVRANL